MVPLIYSANHNITAFGIEKLHPFDSAKYRRIHDWLIAQGIRKQQDFFEPTSCSHDDLLRIHTPEYLEKIRRRTELARILELRVVAGLPAIFTDWRVLNQMRMATGGTIQACRLAREHGLAINLGGGYHHTGRDHGHGFCVYADVPVALACLHEAGPLRSALIVDVDVHQGDGSANIVRSWPWAHLLDFYEDGIFPWPKAQEDHPIPLESNLCGEDYLRILQTHLPPVLDCLAPDFMVYNAGSDVLNNDPLASLLLTVEQLVDRDLYVVTQARRRGIPLAMVLSGGYGPHSWEAHARSIEAITTRFDASTPACGM